ncbi:hypothetical protein [Mucilaginibacter phyllosphaerae]|uniref:Uncharacterized protein n=1 Tax=Mucilaginibacter phyllosphaerae TaxID=1812349 RepID=A0A4Y8A928_9SPHI|nr:hypothetical protein [Mucilaginibacter phyllosphaerae]MBB3969598.1 hypothetical protein [Mucilaginibacter phyllosphaerae]TEW64987.1 hypothetical protein E2R65_13775 [Mucilaginibacter phyllosphaerae]
MKKLSFVFAIAAFSLIAFTALSFKTDPINKPGKISTTLKSRKPLNHTFTFTANGTAASQYYRIQFSSSSFSGTYVFNGAPASIPAGTYSVGIFPASQPTSHLFSGQSCANNYSGSGTSITFSNVLVCSDGYFVIN